MKKIQNTWIDEELILNDSGSFERMWDYMGGDQEDQLPFSFYSGTAEKFSPPRITARKNSRTLLFESKSLQVTLSLEYDRENHILFRRDTLTNLKKKPLLLRRYLARFPLNRGEYEIHSSRASGAVKIRGSGSLCAQGVLIFTPVPDVSARAPFPLRCCGIHTALTPWVFWSSPKGTFCSVSLPQANTV